MFEKGNYVTYRSEGVCVITDIRKESFATENGVEDYYILVPINDMKSTVFVPVSNERLVGYMHKLIDADEMNAIIAELRDERMEWIPESRARSTAFKQIISQGDRRELIVMLNTLYDKTDEMKQNGKKVGATDQGAIARAEKLLGEELMITTNFKQQVSLREVLQGSIILCPKDE